MNDLRQDRSKAKNQRESSRAKNAREQSTKYKAHDLVEIRSEKIVQLASRGYKNRDIPANNIKTNTKLKTN